MIPVFSFTMVIKVLKNMTARKENPRIVSNSTKFITGVMKRSEVLSHKNVNGFNTTKWHT